MTHEKNVFNLTSTYVVLGDQGEAIPVAVGDRFYEDLEQKFGDFKGKRLVSYYTFAENWESWEMHPAGDEIVCLLSGQVDLLLEQNGAEHTLRLNAPGAYALVPRGIWHTAQVYSPSSMLFVTPGEGTQHRAREQ
ncbi:MAG TPA: WxcM-like domain-containing protein [Coleofasciculaceae cyanobacterium]|jgi:uncharacterized cupin superfamily protein